MTFKPRVSILLATIMTTYILMTTTVAQTNSALIVAVSKSIALNQSAFADHGKAIVLSGKESFLLPTSSSYGENQVRIVFNYGIRDPMVANSPVKAVLQLYSPNGTLLKTSSSPTSISLDDDGGTLAVTTSFQNWKKESLTAKIALINHEKTDILSNELIVNAGITGSKLSAEQHDVTQKESQQSYDDDLNARIHPPNDTPTADIMESPRAEPESNVLDVTNGQALMKQDSPPPQLNTGTDRIDTIVMQPLKTNDPFITNDMCDNSKNESNNGMDNSQDNCSQPFKEPANQQAGNQDQIMYPTLEICNDDLDNDIDGKVDVYDDDCRQDISTSLSSANGELRSFDNKQQEWEERDVQQIDDRDADNDDQDYQDKDDKDNKDKDED